MAGNAELGLAQYYNTVIKPTQGPAVLTSHMPSKADLALAQFYDTVIKRTQGIVVEPETVERSYPERYIFLVVAVLIALRILRLLQRHRMEHEFDDYFERQSAFSANSQYSTNIPSGAPIGFTIALPTDITSIVIRPSDDPYSAAAFSASLNIPKRPEVLPPPAYPGDVKGISRAVPPPYSQVKATPLPPLPLDLPES